MASIVKSLLDVALDYGRKGWLAFLLLLMMLEIKIRETVDRYLEVVAARL